MQGVLKQQEDYAWGRKHFAATDHEFLMMGVYVNVYKAHGRFAGKCHIQRQEVDGVSEGPHSCRGPIEPLTGGAQVPRSQVHVAEVGTGELPKCSERPSSKKAGKQVYRRAR
jgi:hypothetical protein